MPQNAGGSRLPHLNALLPTTVHIGKAPLLEAMERNITVFSGGLMPSLKA